MSDATHPCAPATRRGPSSATRLPPVPAIVLALILPGATPAQETPALAVELNKLEQAGDNCRSYMVVTNGTGQTLEALTLDLVVFARDGVIDRRLAADLAPVAAGRTRVKVFDMAGLDCGRVARLLVNDILACRPEAFGGAGCDAALAVSARGPAELVR